ncbi:MAG: tryptophan 7-halogenase [Flavobacteriales bacterium]|nr:tryptophan 7-halogenase [Flavobacteriales bacterium]
MGNSTDVLIIGAGPSGTAAASWLAKQGHTVTVLERAVFPRFVIGESLLPLSMGHWEETGQLPALMEQGYEVKNGASFFRDGKEFDLAFAENYTQGWTWTWQVPRDHFDNILAQEAQRMGADIRFGHEVLRVDLGHPEGVEVVTRHNGQEHHFTGRFLIDSSGYGGTLARLLNLHDKPAGNGRMALFAHVRESDAHRARYPDPMRISFEVLARDLWFWSIPFSDGRTSLGFVGHNAHFTEALALGDEAASMRHMIKLSKVFGDRYADVEFVHGPQRISEYTHHNADLTGERYVLTGNCAGFLDPVFSSGVAFATESGLLAAKLLHRQLKGDAVDWKAEYEAHIKHGTEVFRTYVETWYDGDLQEIFFAGDVEQSHKERIVSVLAGYVWDRSNPYVSKHDRAVRALAQSIRLLRAERSKTAQHQAQNDKQ